MMKTRISAFLLALVFVLLCLPIPVVAETEEESEWKPILPSQQNFATLKEGDLTHSQLQTLSSENVALPETISVSDAIEKELVNRLYTQETDLNTALFQTKSGSKTAYVFDKPIKYVTEEGKVRDKSTLISPTHFSGYSYAMTENSFQVYFGGTTSKGVMLRYGDHAFSMIPEGSLLVSTATLGEDGKTVLYQNAFGAHTALRYTTHLSGLKEDIILLSDVGKYSFQFLLTVSGLTPVLTDDDQWVLVDENQNQIISFGNIVINDSSGKYTRGDLSISPHTANGYIITIEAPQEFLQSNNTVYPVYIDPTSTVQDSNGAYIYDHGIYTSESYYQRASDTPTRHILHANYGKVIYKFPAFYRENTLSINFDEYAIGKVTFHVYSYSTSSSTLTAYPMNATCTDTTTVVLDDSGLSENYSSNHSASTLTNIATGNCFTIDVTEIVRGWARYNRGLSHEDYENPRNGFILSQNGTNDIFLSSTEENMGNNVYYIVDYHEIYGIYQLQNAGSSSSFIQTLDTYNTTSDSYSIACNTGLRENGGLSHRCSFIFKYEGGGKHLITSMYKPGYGLHKDKNSSILPASPTSAHHWRIDLVSSSPQAITIKNSESTRMLAYDVSGSFRLSMVPARDSTHAEFANATWTLYRVSTGEQPYRRLPNYQVILRAIDCAGYAFMRDDSAATFSSAMSDVANSLLISNKTEAQIEAEYYSAAINFFNLALLPGYERTPELSFANNGETAPLEDNQYRVVVRTGIRRKNVGNNNYTIDPNYHFWYQTSDGRWAHKHSTNKPYLLPYGVTPFSHDCGAWDRKNTVQFYNSNVYCCIITIPE